jgi:hypothetical protein
MIVQFTFFPMLFIVHSLYNVENLPASLARIRNTMWEAFKVTRDKGEFGTTHDTIFLY